MPFSRYVARRIGSVWIASVAVVMTTRDGANRSSQRWPPRAGSGSGGKIAPKIRRMAEGRAIAASQLMGSRNSSFASVAMRARISFMTVPLQFEPLRAR